MKLMTINLLNMVLTNHNWHANWNAKLYHYIYNKLDVYIIIYLPFTLQQRTMREKVILLDIYSAPARHAIGPHKARQNPTHTRHAIGPH